MKRLLGLVVLFVVLFVSVPSYGYVLIYNLSGKVTGVNNSVKASIPWKGYFVVTISGFTVVDANLITYGKNSAKTKVYVKHGIKTTGSANLDVTSDILGTLPNIFLTLNIVCDTVDFDLEAITVGKAALVDVGTGIEGVAKRAKGSILVRQGMLLDPADDITGTGNVSSSLWTVGTKYVNQNNWTLEEIINTGRDVDGKHQKSLKDRLAKYTDATP